MRGKLAAICGATAVSFTSVQAAQPAAGQEGLAAQSGWESMSLCAQIEEPDRRHRCTDGVLRQAGLLDAAREEKAARRDFGRDATPEVKRNEERGPAQAQTLKTRVHTARLVGSRLLLVSTEAGSAWQQSQSEVFHALPQPGDGFEIERTALGGYRCKFQRSSVYRCRRVN